jgi:hypothetical protein
MKFLFSAVLLSSLSSPFAVEGESTKMATCAEQAPCLQVIVNEIASTCGSETCEYEVCWQQLVGFTAAGCGKYGHVDYIGDMHRFGDHEDIADGGCVNDVNEDGHGFWDDECTDPVNVYSDTDHIFSFFQGMCQVVSPGHTAHIVIGDGASCVGDATIHDATGRDLHATCGPSTTDSGAIGGQTYFPVEGQPGGTCSDHVEGYECVWSITVPQTCAYEEATPYECETMYHYDDESICANDGSILQYFPNDANPAPSAGVIIHDLHFIDTPVDDETEPVRTVSFRVMSPFNDMVDIYTVYHSAENGDSICNKDESIKECPPVVVMEAMCFENDSWTVVTVFVAGYGPDSETAADVFDAGTEIYQCCETTFSPLDHTHAEYITGYTYLIHCKCESELEEEDVPENRVLQVSEELSRRFFAGELFDDELKTIYGLN